MFGSKYLIEVNVASQWYLVPFIASSQTSNFYRTLNINLYYLILDNKYRHLSEKLIKIIGWNFSIRFADYLTLNGNAL